MEGYESGWRFGESLHKIQQALFNTKRIINKQKIWKISRERRRNTFKKVRKK